MERGKQWLERSPINMPTMHMAISHHLHHVKLIWIGLVRSLLRSINPHIERASLVWAGIGADRLKCPPFLDNGIVVGVCSGVETAYVGIVFAEPSVAEEEFRVN